MSSIPRRPTPVAVNADNFIRAESDMYFGHTVREGGLGRFVHYREVMPIDKQIVIRPNRDTLYSAAIFDLDAAPVTVTLPDAGKRFCSMMVIDENHYVRLLTYDAGPCTLTRDTIGTRYVSVAIRTLVDPGDPSDLKRAHAVQNSIQVSQRQRGSFEVPNWDPASQKKVRDTLLILGSMSSDLRGMFGSKDQVDPVRHLIGTAMAWGGNPEKDAIYLNVTPAMNDGTTIYTLRVKDVPVDGFWSVSVYNSSGYFERNPLQAYSLNNLTALKSADGSITIQFGGCTRKAPNCLPIMKGWNYTVRLYRPRAEILNGGWSFPEALIEEIQELQAA
jgi:hypothetical protein